MPEGQQVKDAYYSYNDQNEKTLNIVREEDYDSGSVMVHSMIGAIAGMALANSLMNSGSNLNNTMRSRASYANVRSKEQEKEKKRTATGGYVAMSKSYASSRIRSNPSRLSTMKSGAMSRVVSARSGGYSGGSRGG